MKKLSNGNFELTRSELFDYIVSDIEITRLKSGGVDNWQGYGDSLYPDDEPDSEDEAANILERMELK